MYTKKSLNKNIQLDDQFYDASESRDSFEINFGNQKYPNLSTRKYGFSHVF